MRPASSTARTTAGSPARPSRSRTTTSRVPPSSDFAVGSERRDEPLAVGLLDRDRMDARQPDLGLERLRRPLGDDVAVVDDPDPVREHVRLLEVLRRQEDGDAVLAGEPGDLVPRGRAALDVEPGRRLVEEEDPRPVHEREREVEPPLHPARVAADLAIGRLVEADAVEQLLRALPCGRRGRSPAASPAGADGRGRSASGRARPPGARRRSRCAPSGLRRRRRSRRRAPSRTSAAAASSASARSSTCRRRSAPGSRRSRPARRAGRSRRPPAAPS